jgi:hypothetical protein
VRRICFVFSPKGACTSEVSSGVEQRLQIQGQGLIVLRTLLVNKEGLEHAKNLISGYQQGKIGEMNADLWRAKQIVDSTLHPGKLSRLSSRWALC